MQKVTPWEVEGDIDYNKLIKEFGLKPIKNLPKKFNDFFFFRRGIIYAHMDFEKITDAVKNKTPFAMMTGLMPSGKFHFGHKMVADEMIFFQKLGAKMYVAVADIEAYTTRKENLDELKKVAIEEYLTNYIALGLNIKKTDFYFQSNRSTNAKKSNAYYRLSGILSKHATFNEFKAVYGEISPGKMTASLFQASDMLHPQLPEFEGKPLPTIIPVGIDQSPHLRIARDMASRLPSYKFTPLSSVYHKFLPGLKGGKMSSSDPTSYISLTDSPSTVKTKINKYAFSGGQPSLQEHRKKGGNPDIDVSYQYLRMLFEPDDKKLNKIYNNYKSGSLLTSELKEILIKKINSFLKKHQQKREQAKKHINKYILP